MPREMIYVPGMLIGQLKILSRNGYRLHCACTCGNEFDTSVQALSNGKENCGHSRPEAELQRIEARAAATFARRMARFNHHRR